MDTLRIDSAAGDGGPDNAPAICWQRHLVVPLLAAGSCWLLLGPGGLDRVIAGLWLDLQGGAWNLRHHLLTETLLHDGGRWLAAAAWLVVLALSLRPTPGRGRTALRYVALSVLLSVSLVSGLKRLSSIECPWDDPAFGGTASSRSAGHCFPAGHASVGYAWVALYFAAGSARWRWAGLGAGLGLGAVFGLGQQLRGAHLASHDVATATVCWAVALACTPLLRKRLQGDEGGL